LAFEQFEQFDVLANILLQLNNCLKKHCCGCGCWLLVVGLVLQSNLSTMSVQAGQAGQAGQTGRIDHILYVDHGAISRMLVEKTRMLGTFWVQDVTTGQKLPPNVINNTPCIICLPTKKVFMPREVVAYVERLLRNHQAGAAGPHGPAGPHGSAGQAKPVHVYRDVGDQLGRIEKIDDPLRGDNQPGAYSFASAYQKRYRIGADGEAGRSMSTQIIAQLLSKERESGPIRSINDTATAREQMEMLAKLAAEEKRLEDKAKGVH
jgi:hypothetical protein